MVAMLFPGQGTHSVGMGRDLWARHAVARDVFDEASSLLGMSVERLCLDASDSELQDTRNAQVAIFVTTAAAHRVLLSAGVHPTIVAGHSVGELAALLAAGSLTFADGLRAVAKRASLMVRLAAEGAMVSVQGLTLSQVESALDHTPDDGPPVVVGLHNAERSVVVSGAPAAVRAAVRRCQDLGARRTIPLRVAHGFHSPLMAPVVKPWRRFVAVLDIRQPEVPVVPNTTATPTRSVTVLRRALVDQIVGRVRWQESMAAVERSDAARVLEVGASRTLSMLWRLDERRMPVDSLADQRWKDDLGALVDHLDDSVNGRASTDGTL